MSLMIREATREDIKDMHRIRLAVKENPLTVSVIQEEDYIKEIEESGRGWVAELGDKIVGFAVGNLRNQTVWALFVDPNFEGRGAGRALHETMMDWYFGEGVKTVQLWTDPNTRAANFYQKAGWHLDRIEKGEARFIFHFPKHRPGLR